MKNETIYLSLGSNMGNSRGNLLQAIGQINVLGIKVYKVSGIYVTEPIGYKDQGDFYNMVLVAKTTFSALESLAICQRVEERMGRTRAIPWGPRVIDIDILYYGEEIVDIPELTIPHREIGERAFVLIPLREVAPEKFNQLGITIPEQRVSLKVRVTDVKILLRKQGMIIN